MSRQFDLKLPSEESPAPNRASSKDHLTAVNCLSKSARRVDSAATSSRPPEYLLHHHLKAQPLNISSALGFPTEMSFPNPRRGSLGSLLGAGDLSFPNSRRNSLAFGLDFDVVDQQQQQQQQLQQQLPTDSIAALPSHSHTMASRSLLNASLAGQCANAQLLLGSTSGREGLTIHQRQILLQQQLQQRHSLPASEPSSDAGRVQAEAQAAAAALFLGAPLPSSDSSPTNGLGLGSLGHLGQAASNSGQGSRNLLGNSIGRPSPLAAPSNFPTSGQDLSLSMQQLRSGAANISGGSGLPSLDVSNLNPLSSFSQLQQLQQQQQLQRLQSSLGGGQSRLQQSSQQLQDQQHQHELQKLQLQQELQHQQQQIRRHSLSMDFPFDISASSQQLEQPQSGLGLSMSEQLRQHQSQLDKLQSRSAFFSSGGNKAALSNRGKTGSKNVDATGNSASKSIAKKDTSFPLKLHEILSNPEYEDMISWMPHGKSWRILKPSAFENVVIPLHFRHSKYASFMRQVSR